MAPPESPTDANTTTESTSRRRFLGAAGAAAAAGLAGCTTPFIRVETTERTVERQFDAADLDRLRVDEATDDIQVERADDDSVQVRARKRAHGQTTPDDLQFDARTEDGTLRLRTRKPDVVGIGGGSVDLSLAVPESVAVDRLETTDGDVVASDVDGDLAAMTGDGSVTLERVGGAVTARSGDGDVTLRAPGAVREVHSGDGGADVTVPAVDGTASVETGDGDVTVRLGDALDATVEATTGDGDLVVAGGLDDVETSTEHRVTGTVGGGTNSLTVHTGDGDVTITGA